VAVLPLLYTAFPALFPDGDARQKVTEEEKTWAKHKKRSRPEGRLPIFVKF
jgi:hypothetical protein